MHFSWKFLALAAAFLTIADAGMARKPIAQPHHPPQHSGELRAGDLYVAMGSSFAAGPGVGMMSVGMNGAGADKRCGRSAHNFAQQLAAKNGLKLVDVSCGGAKTDHITGVWAELPAQIDAVTADTRLVTITIGGNDLGYIGTIISAACRENIRRKGGAANSCFTIAPPSDAAYLHVEDGLRAIAVAVRQRAPKARLIFVEYLAVLPKNGDCADLPMADEDAKASQIIAAKLAVITEKVAQENRAEFLPLSRLSRRHNACAMVPWVNGFKPEVANYVAAHPNLAGMTAIADMLDAKLSK